MISSLGLLFGFYELRFYWSSRGYSQCFRLAHNAVR